MYRHSLLITLCCSYKCLTTFIFSFKPNNIPTKIALLLFSLIRSITIFIPSSYASRHTSIRLNVHIPIRDSFRPFLRLRIGHRSSTTTSLFNNSSPLYPPTLRSVISMSVNRLRRTLPFFTFILSTLPLSTPALRVFLRIMPDLIS